MRAPLVLLALLLPSVAAADRVTVKGTVLEGTVKSISGSSVVMSTVYGDGDLTIPTADVSAIETDAPFHVYKADDGAAIGRVVDISPDAVTVAGVDGGRAEVAFADVQASPRDFGEEASFVQRRRKESPWWSGNFDVSFSSHEGTTDTTALAAAFGATRERGLNRTKIGMSYIRSTNQDDFTEGDGVPGTPDDESGAEDLTANELRGWIRQERDVSKRVFAFGSFEAERDSVEDLQYRLIPKVGAGYKLINTDTTYLAMDAGPAYVYERFDDERNDYAALAFGAEARKELPWGGSSWFARADYLPSVTDPLSDYRLRGETGLIVPLVDPINFKASLIDDYNGAPNDDTAHNTLTTLLGLSLVY